MNISEPFIRRPIATSLLMAALALVGVAAFPLLPVAPLPQVDFPTIQVTAQFAGASAATMAATVATPLEEQFGQIAGVTQLTSASVLGTSVITLQFDLNRNIDGAAQDVQAAITAAGKTLPQNLTVPPFYRKVNPADAPILILAPYSDTLPVTSVDDFAENVIAQQISQISGVALVTIGGQQKPAIRVQVDPARLEARGLTLEDLRGVLATATTDAAKGAINGDLQTFTIATNDQLTQPEQYGDIIIAYRGGAPVRVRDVGHAITGPQDVTQGALNGVKPSVLLLVFKQPGANVINTVDAIKAAMPRLAKIAPAGIKIDTIVDRTQTIRASVHDVEVTLAITIGLVVMVILLFLRNAGATLIPSVTVPLALLGSTALMYLFGFSLDNLSLMALTISVGFVVDDAIVVVENIYRHIEAGLSPMLAALKGAQRDWIHRALNQHFAGRRVHSAAADGRNRRAPVPGIRDYRRGGHRSIRGRVPDADADAQFALPRRPIRKSWPHLSRHRMGLRSTHRRLSPRARHGVAPPAADLDSFLRHRGADHCVVLKHPKGLFPGPGHRNDPGFCLAGEDVSPGRMRGIQQQLSQIIARDPDVVSFGSFFGNGGGNTLNTSRFFISLKPRDERKATVMDVINRLRPQLANVQDVTLFLQPSQDITVGGRISAAQFQYTLQNPNFTELNTWAPRLLTKLKTLPELTDVSSDQQANAPLLTVTINRDAAARFGIQAQEIDATLNDAFGQADVTQYFTQASSYYVVLEILPELQKDPLSLNEIYVKAPVSGQLVPLSTLVSFNTNAVGPLSVAHQAQFPAATLSFNLQPGVALGQAVTAIERAQSQIGMPTSIMTSFQGNAQAFQTSLASEPILIVAALLVVYVILGVLYESYIHPLTILSTLPSAGVGALLALWAGGFDLSVIGIIGIILLIGIVKKNGIMLVDFAITREREGLTPEAAIREACLLRFRPIMMTTMAALLGGLPLMLGTGSGSELRQPLGYAMVGGLILSQMLTLFTTPVVYLYLDRLQNWLGGTKPHEEPARMLEAAE